MSAPRKIFVFDRKELMVLSFLSVTVAFFSFTMGIHLGKTVAPATGVLTEEHAHGLETDEDPLPNRQEFVERSKGIDQEADLALSKSLHDEVEKTGIRLEVSRQVELPQAARTVEAGKTTLQKRELKKISESTPDPKYTLQVGSYPSIEEAQKVVERLQKSGMTVSLRAADLKSLGRRYRIFVGKFESKDAAVAAGDQYREKKFIESYVVSNRAE